VTVLAHDLRNHLTPIRARIDILATRARREGHSANLADTTKLRQCVDRLSRLISDLLDIARVDQGLFMVSPEPLDLGYLLRDLRDAVGSAEVGIEVHAPPELCVLADPMRLRQALENLLANAVQHSPRGGGAVVALELATEQRDGRSGRS
jgi:signal transduction histidine kinase